MDWEDEEVFAEDIQVGPFAVGPELSGDGKVLVGRSMQKLHGVLVALLQLRGDTA